jgi:hypothetical protein
MVRTPLGEFAFYSRPAVMSISAGRLRSWACGLRAPEWQGVALITRAADEFGRWELDKLLASSLASIHGKQRQIEDLDAGADG